MSSQWNSSQFQQGLPSQGNQVRMFDPSQFQAPGAQTSKPRLQHRQPNVSTAVTQPAPPVLPAHSSWNSWGSWDWNSEKSAPSSGDQQQQVQQQEAVTHNHQQVLSESGGQHYSDVSTWNQGWDNSGQYSQPQQAYAQPDTSVQYQNQQQQPQWDNQYAGSSTGQGQYSTGLYTPEQYGTNNPGAQYQEQNQYQQHFTGSYYDYQQQQAVDQGQSYQDQGQYQGHVGTYNVDTWMPPSESGQWVQPQLPSVENSRINATAEHHHQQQVNHSQNPNTESIAQPASHSYAGQDVAFSSTSLDDDGTVSGFFGRDGDGDVQVDAQRHGYSYAGDGALTQGQNDGSRGQGQFLPVTSGFHGTNSASSSTSLSTFNLPKSDDSNRGRHQQRVEDAVLTQRDGEERNRGMADPLTEQHQRDAVVQREAQQIQEKGEYSVFAGPVFTPSHNLPLDTNLRSSSPDAEHPDSAESGGSGGSSGLTDWEIVPPQTGLLAFNHNSSLDNTGPVSVSNSYGNFDNQDKSPHASLSLTSLSDTSAQNVPKGFQNLDPSKHSSAHDLLTTSVQGFTHTYNDTREQSGIPSVGPSTDQQKKSSLPPQLPLLVSAAPPVSVNSDQEHTVAPQSDVPVNPFRRDDEGRRQQHARVPQPANPVLSSSSSAFLKSSADAHSTEQKSATSLGSIGSRSAETLHSSKSQPPHRTLVESKGQMGGQKSGHSINSSDVDQTKDSSRSSEEFTAPSQQQQHHHHSAFHPVSRQRQTVSSATTLWDSSEAPTSNILLAPVVPLIIPALNPYSVSAAATATTSVAGATASAKVDSSESVRDDSRSKGPGTSADLSQQQIKVREKREEFGRGRDGRGKEDKNRSFDSMDEISADGEGKRERSYRSQRGEERESRGQSYDKQHPSRRDSDRPVSRGERPSSRSERGDHYQYDEPSTRSEGYSKDVSSRRHHGYYKDYGDGSYDERYDRPRSRQDESHGSRPSSRSAGEFDKSRARAEYDHGRDYYYRSRHRGYGYDIYGRNVDYYNDERDRYYRYNRDKDARYAHGYYEEYYGAKYAEYYKYEEQQRQLLQQQQQQQGGRLSSQDFDRSSNQSQSRGSTPAIAPSPGIPSSLGQDYYGSRDSRPTSRTDYSQDYYGRGYAYDGYNAYFDGYGYDPYTYGYGYPGYDEYNQAYGHGRMTPPKYSYPHVRACFGPGGQLVKVLPNRPADGQPAIVEIQDVQTVLESCPEAEELTIFPGPLTRNTHKKDVLLFCQQKARACAENINMMDRESAQLIWRFLELLIKQNGSVVGTDLSDLLLEGHEPSTHEYSLHGMKISQSPETLDTVPEGNSEGSSSTRASPAVQVTSDRTVITSADGEREKWVDRFRHLLLYGRKKDALECAIKNNLWGHALFLASKMDVRTHANVMTRFANSAMRMNDPLQTLYQLMSGRQPAAVTCVVDERWGDWRPHLAMILSNQSSKRDIDHKSMTTLGDTLAAKGYLHASHFCYLMARVNFGNYFKKTSKIVLIGSSHNLPMEEFATSEAIQCTEVYEYAQTLGNSAFCLPHLQIYKYLYACRLADYGKTPEAFQYCEVIANCIQQFPNWFQSSFAKLVYQLSSKLKYCDLQRQMSGEFAEDPVWLQQLENVCQGYDDGSIQPLSGTATPAGLPGTTSSSSDSGEYTQHGYTGDAAATYSLSAVHSADAHDHQQQQQAHPDSATGHSVSSVTGQIQNLGIADQHQQYDYSQWQQHYGAVYQHTGYGEQQQQQSAEHQQHPQQGQQHYGSTAMYAGSVHSTGDVADGQATASHSYTDDISSLGGSQLDSSSLSTQVHSQGFGVHGAGQLPPAAGSISTTEDEEDGGGDDDVISSPAASFDYFGNVGTHKVVAPPHRYRSMSGSSTGSIGRRRTISGSSTGSVKAAPPKTSSQQQQQPVTAKGGDKFPQKSGEQDNGGSGWFGGLFNKFKVKGKNEMILPDDKNPAIVWDPVKKKWSNADGTEEEEAPRVPPPKDTDLLGKSSAAAAPSALDLNSSGMAGGNRFSLKAKGVRNQYVNISNTTPVSAPQSLFSVTPGSTAASPSAGATAAQLLLPGPASVPNTAAAEVNNSNVNNNALTGLHSEDNSMGNVAGAAPSLPVLFNPASLKGGSSGVGKTSSAAGPGLKYGQRRAYPK